MRIIGLDLSLTSTGIATPQGYGCIRSKHRGMVRLAEISSLVRLRVESSIGGFWDAVRQPDLLVVIEGYSFGSRASQAHALGELGGVVRLDLYRRGIAFVDVPPATLKKYATGKGNAGKEEMLVAAVRRLGYEGASNDEADALWLRAMGCDAYGAPLAVLPAVQRAALTAIEWPAPDGLVSA